MALSEQEEFELLSLEREKALLGRNATPAMPSYDPTEGMSGTRKFLAGAGKGLTDVVRGVGQLVGLTDQASVDEAKARDSALSNTVPGMAGDLVGNLAATMVPGIGAQGLLARGVARVAPALAAQIAGAAGSGALVSGVTTPTATGESRGVNAALGAAGGAGGDVLARGMARVAQPVMQSANVRDLLREGIVPTPGQAAGADSFLGRIEQRLQSIPLVGDLITGGRNRATAEFNEAAINRAVPDGSARIQGIGRGALEQVDRVLSDGYNEVLDRIGTVQAQPAFMNAVRGAMTDPDLALSPPMQQRLEQIVNAQINMRGDPMTAQVAKRADANLGMFARNFTNSQDGDQKMLARALRQVQTAWRGNIAAHATPEDSAQLQNLNRAFANFVRVERAAGATGAREGVFTPAQLQRAVKATDTSARHGQFARGGALMQDLTDPATATLSQTVPNSGTPERLMLALGLGGAAGAGTNEYFGGPGYLSALALSPLLFSRAGSRYMLGDLLPGQQGVAALARRGAPYAAQGSRSLIDLFNEESAKTK